MLDAGQERPWLWPAFLVLHSGRVGPAFRFDFVSVL